MFVAKTQKTRDNLDILRKEGKSKKTKIAGQPAIAAVTVCVTHQLGSAEVRSSRYSSSAGSRHGNRCRSGSFRSRRRRRRNNRSDTCTRGNLGRASDISETNGHLGVIPYVCKGTCCNDFPRTGTDICWKNFPCVNNASVEKSLASQK